jgi:hypothetical protein
MELFFWEGMQIRSLCKKLRMTFVRMVRLWNAQLFHPIHQRMQEAVKCGIGFRVVASLNKI